MINRVAQRHTKVCSRHLLLLSVVFTCLSNQITAAPQATIKTTTAAEHDWRPGAAVNTQCRGSYVEPAPAVADDGAIRASAGSAIHIENHSTTLTNDVEVIREGQTITADFATLDDTSEVFTAQGNVRLRQPGMLLQGDTISGNLFSDIASIDSATFLLHESELRGKARAIRKTADATLEISDGEFTTCEPGDNTWAVRGDSIELKTAEGYGEARGMTLRIKDVPVVYLPYFRFPIDRSRQSGFLWPLIGHDSEGGTDIALPYYFNLAPNYDATYTLRSIWKRGLLHEGELRYLNNFSSNAIAGTFLPSDDEYDNRTVIPAGTGNDFDKQDRWLAHISHRGRHGPWSSRINYTSVSDIDYLDDLDGFTATDPEFDQGLNRRDAPALTRSGSLAYNQKLWSSQLELRSFQTLNQVQPRQYEILPRLTVKGRQQLGRARFEGLMQATQFDKSNDLDPTGSRLVLDATASAPLRNAWGYVTPKVRVIHRDYSLDNTGIGDRDSASVTTTLASVDSGITLERTTSLFGYDIAQTLEPRLHYLYANEEFQDDLPTFDSTELTPGFEAMFRDNRYTGYDRIGDANRFAAGLTTRLSDLATGNSLITASIGRMFYLDDREVNLGSIGDNNPTDSNSPIFISISGSAAAVRAGATYEYDTKRSQSNRGYVYLQFRNRHNAIFNLNYSMTDASQQRRRIARNEEESDLSFYWPLGRSSSWQLIGRWNYGWDRGQTIESLFGVEYNDCCWKVRTMVRRNLREPRVIAITDPVQGGSVFLDRRAETGIFFEFQLKGMASLGGRLDALLRSSIPNYTAEEDR